MKYKKKPAETLLAWEMIGNKKWLELKARRFTKSKSKSKKEEEKKNYDSTIVHGIGSFFGHFWNCKLLVIKVIICLSLLATHLSWLLSVEPLLAISLNNWTTVQAMFRTVQNLESKKSSRKSLSIKTTNYCQPLHEA